MTFRHMLVTIFCRPSGVDRIKLRPVSKVASINYKPRILMILKSTGNYI